MESLNQLKIRQTELCLYREEYTRLDRMGASKLGELECQSDQALNEVCFPLRQGWSCATQGEVGCRVWSLEEGKKLAKF